MKFRRPTQIHSHNWFHARALAKPDWTKANQTESFYFAFFSVTFVFFLSLKKSWSFDCPIKENMGTVIVLSTVVASLSVLYQSCAIRKGQRWNIYTFTRTQGMRVNDKKGNQIDKKVDCKIEWKLIQRSTRFYYSLPPTDSPTVFVSKFISSDSSMLEF